MTDTGLRTALPDGFSARPVLASDFDDVLALIVAADMEDLGHPDFTADDLAADWTNRRVDTARDGVVVTDPQSNLRGYLLVVDENPGIEVYADLYVHPGARGGTLERYLVEEALVLAQRHVDEAGSGASLLAYAGESGPRADALRGAHLTPRRAFWRLTRPLDAELPAVAPPDGVTVGPFDPDVDAEQVHAVVEGAFEGHWGAHQHDLETWWESETGDGFDPELWRVARRGARIVGALLGRPPGPDGNGFIRRIGVAASERRRGIGGALLRDAFHAYRARGAMRVNLGVDSENRSGATTLYEREGMARTHVIVAYVRRLEPRDRTA